MALSARTKKALDQSSAKLADHLRRRPDQPLADVAHTLLKGRRWFEQRRVVVASSHEEAVQRLEDGDRLRVFTHTANTDKASVVFTFPGGGAQYPNMARALYDREPSFKATVDRGFEWLRAKTGVDYKALVFPAVGGEEAAKDKLGETPIQLPLIFLVEVALAELWQSWGGEARGASRSLPSAKTRRRACRGSSASKTASAWCCCGASCSSGPKRRAWSACNCRGRASSRCSRTTSTSRRSMRPTCASCQGTVAAVEWLEAKLTSMEVDFRRLKIKAASHTRTLDPILPDFRAYLRSITLSPPTIPFVSNRTERLDHGGAGDRPRILGRALAQYDPVRRRRADSARQGRAGLFGSRTGPNVELAGSRASGDQVDEQRHQLTAASR